MSHWKMMNIYCTFLNTETHKVKVQSHNPKLLSRFIGRESRKGDRAGDSYISINTYIQHITLITWHLQYIVIKDLSWRKEELFQWECFFFDFIFFFFCHGRIIVFVSAFVLFIIINIIVLLVGWWLGVTHLRLWLVVLALLWTEKNTLQLKMITGDLSQFIHTEFNLRSQLFLHRIDPFQWCCSITAHAAVCPWILQRAALASLTQSRTGREHIPTWS